eukprot:COSAG02_NODE_31579_length_531_cov_0.814815_1_plen_65_part_10
MVAAEAPLSKLRPGNGGLRIMDCRFPPVPAWTHALPVLRSLLIEAVLLSQMPARKQQSRKHSASA